MLLTDSQPHNSRPVKPSQQAALSFKPLSCCYDPERSHSCALGCNYVMTEALFCFPFIHRAQFRSDCSVLPKKFQTASSHLNTVPSTRASGAPPTQSWTLIVPLEPRMEGQW